MNQKVLINFKCPIQLKHEFDLLVRYKNLSKTSVILNLIENYVRSESIKMRIKDPALELERFDDVINPIFPSDEECGVEYEF